MLFVRRDGLVMCSACLCSKRPPPGCRRCLLTDNACLTLAAPCNLGDAATAAAVIGDGDTGYGNAVNVKRTVAGYAAAGFAGILLEDQQVCWGAGSCCLGAV